VLPRTPRRTIFGHGAVSPRRATTSPLPSHTRDRPGGTSLLLRPAGRRDGLAAPTLLIPSPLAILGQAHVEEHQEQSASEPGRDQDNGEHLTGQSAHQSCAEHTGNHEQAG
jgi:hypothetical protein